MYGTSFFQKNPSGGVAQMRFQILHLPVAKLPRKKFICMQDGLTFMNKTFNCQGCLGLLINYVRGYR